MGNIKVRHIIGLVIAWLLMRTHIIFVVLSLTIVAIVIRDYRKGKTKSNEPKIEENQRLEINDTSYEQIRLANEIAEEKSAERIKIKQETDVRQFKGRTDVTKEEVFDYMFNKDKYVGFETQQIHLERIMEVCNFNEEERAWVTHELWGKTKVLQDEEGQAFDNYMCESIKKGIKNYETISNIYWNEGYKLGIFTDEQRRNGIAKEQKNYEQMRKRYFYDEWLKEKGYV